MRACKKISVYQINKKDLYLFLWENCAQTTIKYLTESGCYQQDDLFEMLRRGIEAKIRIMHKYPFMGSFVIKAYYDKDSEVYPEIQKSYEKHKDFKMNETLAKLDPKQFVEGIDMRRMHREMYLASEGYLWEMICTGSVDVEKVEKDFNEMIAFWKKIYLRKEG